MENKMMEENNYPDEMDEINSTSNEPTLYVHVFFDIPRHNLVTKTAMKLFAPKTSAKVEELLAPLNLNFADIGGWADEIKKAKPPGDKETEAFLNEDRNKNFHRKWHYVNLPLGVKSYEEAETLKKFTKPNDVVQMIKECVRVLQGKSDRFSQVNALRLIGHLVGDVHQPLHVGCGFIDDLETLPKFAQDPKTIIKNKFNSDGGGNAIRLPEGAGKLHSYWDGGLGGLVSSADLESFSANDSAAQKSTVNQEIEAELIEELYQSIMHNSGASAATSKSFGLETSLQPEDLAREWANHSLVIAREAYKTMEITERVVKKKPDGSNEVTYKIGWEGRQKYNERCAPLLKEQMRLAARHLAELLNKIWE